MDDNWKLLDEQTKNYKAKVEEVFEDMRTNDMEYSIDQLEEIIEFIFFKLDVLEKEIKNRGVKND